MKSLLISTVFVSAALAADPGLPARATAADYPAYAEDKGVRVGAELMDPDVVRGSFSTDLGNYAVVEVAVYPAKDGKPIDLSAIDFAMKFEGRTIRPATPRSIAGVNQRRGQARSRDIVLYPNVGLTTGSWGTGTSVGVGVGMGGPGAPPGPASTDRDRDVMEMELEEKELKDAVVSKPVAGYLYFPVGKTKSKTPAYELHYEAEGVAVRVPLKTP
jgi:hypothetical protein